MEHDDILNEIEKVTKKAKKGNYVAESLLWEQRENLKEKQRIDCIKKVMVRQYLYPELAARIMTYDELHNFDKKDLECIIESYQKNEMDIATKLGVAL